MIGATKWSYKPYKPLLRDMGDIHICRIAPAENSIHFEWLSVGSYIYKVYVSKRGENSFTLCGETETCEFDIAGLEKGADYEFYVECNGLKSATRLARTGETVGTVVNYLHPEDDFYSFSGSFIASPSILRHPDGYLLSSMDVFAADAPQNLTFIFRSDDDGKTWHYVCDVYPCFWGKLFLHKGDVYLLSVNTEYGDLLIGKSEDGGNSFSAPVTLFRGCGGKKGSVGVHKNPQPVVNYNGRIWNTLEWGSWSAGYHAPMVMSCAEDDDLLNPANWAFTPPLKFNNEWQGVAKGETNGNIEGTLVVAPDGNFYNIMRYDTTRCEPRFGLAVAYKVNTEDPHAPLSFSHVINFMGNLAKFSIKPDEKTGKYYTIIDRITGPDATDYCSRNLLSLMVSDDLCEWNLVTNVYNFKPRTDHKVAGFQYTDFLIEGDDIIFLCRVALNDAPNGHDSNYQVFDKIENFRNI